METTNQLSIPEMKEYKKSFGLSNRQIAEESGVPIGTVQKIFGGYTATPRYDTLIALSKVFIKRIPPQSVPGSWEKLLAGAYSDSGGMSYSKILRDPGVPYNAKKANNSEKTMDDYLALPPDRRVELIDGVFYDMASPTFIHQHILSMISHAFTSFVMDRGGKCMPVNAPMDVQLDADDKTVVQPDVMIVCDRDKITRERIVGAPDLVVEILSPSNWYHDMVLKMRKYRKAGVREYWIVLPEKKEILVYQFEGTADESGGGNERVSGYSFEEEVPVGIWDGKCKVNFRTIYERIQFLYED